MTATARSVRLLVFALVLASLPLHAQQPPPLAGIAHVALRVRDLAAARSFYQSLGFEEAFDLRRDNIPYESFIKINDHQFIELYPATQNDPSPAFLHLCFEANDLQTLRDDYVAHGLTPTAVQNAGAGNLLFTMPGPAHPIDPTGRPIVQNIEFTEYRPGSLHSNDAGKHLGPDRIADRLLSVALSMADPDSARDFYLNQLSFKPLPGDQMVLHLPGHSGDQVEIAQPTLGPRARITLQTANLGRAARRLGHEPIKFEKTAEILAFTDPDGNRILIQQR